MNELLSPAGTKESFYAAISNGANAIYLGLDKFSARAYADNFNLSNLKELVDFAHLRNVKVYVTINTIIYDFELEDCYKTIDQLSNMQVDAIIVQDLAILDYIHTHYKSIKAHASTQMGIDDINGAKLVKELGASRIVVARETPLNTIKEIKDNLDIELEAFIHGALCVGYSGNCLMSSSIGERSGNRGRCAGCCRKVYSLVDSNTNKIINTSYLLSMKDLNTSEYINRMKFIDSFKIEGRMKEPSYVAAVTRYYRNILDNKDNDIDINKVFNRTYTKGFINNEDIKNITNIDKPNNFGYRIGTVDRWSKNKCWIKLSKPLNKNDQIRIETDNKFEELSIHVDKVFDSSFKEVPYMTKMAIISLDTKVKEGSKVYITKDNRFYEDIKKTLIPKEYNKLDIDIEFNGQIGKVFFVKFIYDKKYKVYVKSDFIIEQATTSSTTKEEIITLLSRLNDTPYKVRNINVNIDDNAFIPLKYINDIRRIAIEKLNVLRLDNKVILNQDINSINTPKFNLLDKKEITVEVSNIDQYNKAKELGIKHIYFNNIIRRNNALYKDIKDKEVLVGGLGGINYYKNKNILISDYSFNVVNYKTVNILHNLGVNRITLSQEISLDSINNLVDNYYSIYNTYPNLELIVYGKTKLMHTKYCPLNKLGLCGKCKESKYYLKDEYSLFPLVFNDDCTVTILNGKTLNNIDDINNIKGVNYIRLVFNDESTIEVENIIKLTKEKLNGNDNKVFNNELNTRGHLNKNPL